MKSLPNHRHKILLPLPPRQTPRQARVDLHRRERGRRARQPLPSSQQLLMLMMCRLLVKPKVTRRV
jgi:hypothetical protein